MDPSISTGHGEEPAEASASAEPSAAEPSPLRPPLLHSKSELPLPRPKPRPTVSSSTVPTTSGTKLKRESLISLGDEFDYGLPPGGSGSSTRDRSRVERWLEQQCRFSTFAQDEDVGAEGADRGADGTSRGVEVAKEEEAVLPYVGENESMSKTRDLTSLSLSTTEEALGGSRGGITSLAVDASLSPSPAREAAVEALPPLLSLSVSPAANAPSERAHAPAHNADAHAGADRADSPLLGYTSAPESPVDTFLSGRTGTGTGGAGGGAGAATAVLQARPAGFGRHVRVEEASDRLQVHEGLGLASSELGPGPAQDEDEEEDLDALLRPPDRKFTYGSDLPVNVSSESLALLHPMVAEDMTTRRVREREQLVVDGERDKLLPADPASSSTTPRPPFTLTSSTTTSLPHSSDDAHEINRTLTTTIKAQAQAPSTPASLTVAQSQSQSQSPASPSSYLTPTSTSTTTTASSTPESSFTVPSAVSAPSESDALCTPPPPTPHLAGLGSLGGGFSPSAGQRLNQSQSQSQVRVQGLSGYGGYENAGPGHGVGVGVEDPSYSDGQGQGEEGILDYPLSLSLSLPLTLPSPLTVPGLSSPAPTSPAYTSSNSASTFTAQQARYIVPDADGGADVMVHGKKKHSPAPSYSSSHTASSSASSHSRSHSRSGSNSHSASMHSARSVHSAQSHSALSSAYSHSHSRTSSKAGSVVGSHISHSSSSKPLLSRSSSTSSFSRQPSYVHGPGHAQAHERQRKAYLPLGPNSSTPNTPNSSASHSRSPSSLSGVSSASGGQNTSSTMMNMTPVQRPERKSSLANLRASLAMASAPGSPRASVTSSPALSRRPSRTLHAVLSETAEGEDMVVPRPERKSSLVNLRASMATIVSSPGVSSPSLSRRPSRASAKLSGYGMEAEKQDFPTEEQVASAASGSTVRVPRQNGIGIQNDYDEDGGRGLELEARAAPIAPGANSVSAAPAPAPVGMGVSMGFSAPASATATAAAAAANAGATPAASGGVGMYHLPTAMLRASRSSSTLLLDRDAYAAAGSSSTTSATSATTTVSTTTLTANTPIPTSPLPPSAPPTRRQSRAADAQFSYGHSTNLSISSSVTTSSSRSRSRAGSLTLNGLLPNPNATAATTTSGTPHVHTLAHAPSMSSIASGASSRHAVYIDSEQVREKLDELLARAAASGGEEADGGLELELERQWLYDSEVEGDEGEDGNEDEDEREGVLGAWSSNPALGRGDNDTGGIAGGAVGTGQPAQGQERHERRDAHAQNFVMHRGLGGTRTPSALNLNLNMSLDPPSTTTSAPMATTSTPTTTIMTSGAATSSLTRLPPPAPVNTPATAMSMTPITDLPLSGATTSTATASTTYFSAVHSASTSTPVTGLSNAAPVPSLYQNPHASSSQVYIGPGQLQLQQQQAHAQASSSPTRSSGRSAGSGGSGGVHSRDTSRSSNSNSTSHSHSSSGHSHGQGHGQGHTRMPSSLSRTQSRTQIHSRTSSQHSRSQSAHSRTQSQSRSHSRAASKEKAMSPKQLLAQLPPTPLSAPAGTSSSSGMMSGEQSPSPLPMSMSMSIPVPLRLPPMPNTGRKPNRPPPAPPLDLGGVDVNVGLPAAPVGDVLSGDEHDERMREMMLAVGPDADEQLGVDPAVAMAGGGFVDVGADVHVEERMVFARGGRDDEEDGDPLGYESDEGFEVVTEMRRRTKVTAKLPVAPAEEVRRVSKVVGGKAGEESGSEGEEMTVEDIERMQFLRGLHLEDRMEMPDIPAAADLDSMLVEFPRAPGSLPPSPERVLGRPGAGAQPPEVHFAEGDVLVTTPPRGGLEVPSGPSMSRWSLASSLADDSPSGGDGKEKKDRERKRKSFVSFGGGKEKEKDKESGNLSPGLPEGDKEKKRGRLASFISRLSSVGGGSAPMAVSSSSSGSMGSSAGDVPPPVPAVPAASLLLPSPQIIDSSKKKDKEKEALPPLPLDADGVAQARAFPRATPPALKLDLSKTQNQTKQKYVVEKDEVVEVAGSVAGVWGSGPSTSTSTTVPAPAPTKAAKSAPGSPVDIAYARAVMGMPTFSFGRSYPKPPKPKKPVPSRTQSAQPLGKTSSDGSIASKPSISISTTSRSTKEADQSHQLARERSNSTAGSGSSAKRPPLVKSASASLLRQIPPPPKISRAGSAAPGVPASEHLQTYPPQPHSQDQRVPYHNQVQYQYRAPRITGADGDLPPTPSSLASTDVDEQEEEELDPEMDRIRREKAHEDRWANVRRDADAHEAALDNARLQPVQPRTDSPILQRPRLKSMTSLGNLRSASASANALSSFPSTGPQIQLSPKSGKGFRGFVMGLVGSSASNTPVSSYPGTPLNGSSPGPLSVSIPGSASASTAAFPLSPTPEIVESTPTTSWSPSHSPTTSLSGGNSISTPLPGTGLGSVSLLGMKGVKGPKRKLVISGVAVDDVKGYEAVKSWCESFGEVREMTRAPNGNLYVDFKKASVAETVCRLQAQVYIKGAGSVSLSWYTKRRPT